MTNLLNTANIRIVWIIKVKTEAKAVKMRERY